MNKEADKYCKTCGDKSGVGCRRTDCEWVFKEPEPAKEKIIKDGQNAMLRIYERKTEDLLQPCDFMEIGFNEDQAWKIYELVQSKFETFLRKEPTNE